MQPVNQCIVELLLNLTTLFMIMVKEKSMLKIVHTFENNIKQGLGRGVAGVQTPPLVWQR